MALAQDQIKHIAKLSRLALTPEEIEHYRQNLDAVVEYMDILKSFPADKLAGVELSAGAALMLRPDEVEACEISRESLLAVSPQKKIAGSIALPNIMG